VNRNDIQEFERYWVDTANAVEYRLNTLKTEKGYVLDSDVKRIHVEEAINKRWFSKNIIHGSKVWLSDFTSRNPSEGEIIANRIKNFRPDAGIHVKKCGIDALETGGFAVVGGTVLKKLLKVRNPLAIAAIILGGSTVFAGKGVKKAVTQNNNVISDIKKQMRAAREEINAVIEAV
jgi:hypothetical protein